MSKNFTDVATSQLTREIPSHAESNTIRYNSEEHNSENFDEALTTPPRREKQSVSIQELRNAAAQRAKNSYRKPNYQGHQKEDKAFSELIMNSDHSKNVLLS